MKDDNLGINQLVLHISELVKKVVTFQLKYSQEL